MAKPPASSVLLLELEDLKEHMSKVQAEVDRCVTILAVQRDEVCGVLARLDTVTAIVRAVEMLDKNKKTEKKKSFPDPVLDTDLDFNYNTLVAAAESKESFCAFREGEQHFPFLGNQCKNPVDVNYRNEEIISKTFKPESLGKAGQAGEVCLVISTTVEDSVVAEENEIMTTVGDGQDSLENVLPSTRPSLSRKCRKNINDKRNILEDAVSAATVTTATLDTKSVSSCLVPSNSKMSTPSSVTSGNTSSSMKMSTSSMVDRVKEICGKKGWRLVGGYNTREGKEGCGVVHFYKLEVKGGMIDQMTRGVGGSKVEAVRRAFKTMENKLIEGDLELGEKVGNVQLKKQDGLCDNFVNFLNEEPMIAVKSEPTSEDSLSPPPVFHSKDCIAQDTLGEKEDKRSTEIVEKTLTVSDYDAGAIIGSKGTSINKIVEETGVKISVRDLSCGRFGGQGRLVKLWGEKACVDKALNMMKKITKKWL